MVGTPWVRWSLIGLLALGSACSAPGAGGIAADGTAGDSMAGNDNTADGDTGDSGSPGSEAPDAGDGTAGGGATMDRFVVFEDPDSDFMTQDVLDVGGDIVRFDAEAKQLFWVADELSFGGFDVNGNLLSGGFFSVRFGSEGGQRMAYFIETNRATICDISIQAGRLRIVATNVTVPQS